MTAANPGAIAIVQVDGPQVESVLEGLSGVQDWPEARLRFVRFADIDEGCAVVLRSGSEGLAQLMPHGGPRVVSRLIDALVDAGCVYGQAVDARRMYPEAETALEADMLRAMSQAASPAALDLLMEQPALWNEAVGAPVRREPILVRSRALRRLLEPATVVVVGAPNVGKSTLTNEMLGRTASVVADLPGTTRDWVAGLVELGSPDREIAVRWLDTPGFRSTDDPVERRAANLARQVIGEADVLIAMRDPDSTWLDNDLLPRAPDLWLLGKIDDGSLIGQGVRDDPLAISAAKGHQIEVLKRRVLELLDLDALQDELWAFSDRLVALLESNDLDGMRDYVGAKSS
ncbi:MAG: hypothetical protein CMJ18_11825 [Phycisphaeraceae bacterium]|nr:hypothetical protein [Phycisphaeraceae bacterium]